MLNLYFLYTNHLWRLVKLLKMLVIKHLSVLQMSLPAERKKKVLHHDFFLGKKILPFGKNVDSNFCRWCMKKKVYYISSLANVFASVTHSKRRQKKIKTSSSLIPQLKKVTTQQCKEWREKNASLRGVVLNGRKK